MFSSAIQASSFENSPQSKLAYNIHEDEIKNFETLVKVDKKTEEKLMKSFIDLSTTKERYRTNLSSIHKAGNRQSTNKKSNLTVLETPDEPILSPPTAV